MKHFLLKIEFLKFAKLEFDASISYYEKESEALAKRFKKEIRTSIDLIIQFPTLYPIIEGDIRKCVTHTFPYTIYYQYTDETIYIYAIASHHKNPETYSDRFKI